MSVDSDMSEQKLVKADQFPDYVPNVYIRATVYTGPHGSNDTKIIVSIYVLSLR